MLWAQSTTEDYVRADRWRWSWVVTVFLDFAERYLFSPLLHEQGCSLHNCSSYYSFDKRPLDYIYSIDWPRVWCVCVCVCWLARGGGGDVPRNPYNPFISIFCGIQRSSAWRQQMKVWQILLLRCEIGVFSRVHRFTFPVWFQCFCLYVCSHFFVSLDYLVS